MCFNENLEGKYFSLLKYITGDEMRIYLDTCCYNRQFDEQNSERILSEANAMFYIRNEIRNNNLELVTSYMLHYENSQKKDEEIKKRIENFFRMYRKIYIGIEFVDELENLSKQIKSTGIKEKDSYHVASAILAKADYFISVDDRLLKYKSNEIKLVNPIQFVNILEATKNDK